MFYLAAAQAVQAFKEDGEDSVIADSLIDLVDGMNKLAGNDMLYFMHIKEQILARDREIEKPLFKVCTNQCIAWSEER